MFLILTFQAWKIVWTQEGYCKRFCPVLKLKKVAYEWRKEKEFKTETSLWRHAEFWKFSKDRICEDIYKWSVLLQTLGLWLGMLLKCKVPIVKAQISLNDSYHELQCKVYSSILKSLRSYQGFPQAQADSQSAQIQSPMNKLTLRGICERGLFNLCFLMDNFYAKLHLLEVCWEKGTANDQNWAFKHSYESS